MLTLKVKQRWKAKLFMSEIKKIRITKIIYVWDQENQDNQNYLSGIKKIRKTKIIYVWDQKNQDNQNIIYVWDQENQNNQKYLCLGSRKSE